MIEGYGNRLPRQVFLPTPCQMDHRYLHSRRRFSHFLSTSPATQDSIATLETVAEAKELAIDHYLICAAKLRRLMALFAIHEVDPAPCHCFASSWSRKS